MTSGGVIAPAPEPGQSSRVKYTEDRVQRILTLLEAGHSQKAAYTFAAVSKSQFFEWKRIHTDFGEAVEMALAKAHVGVTNKLIEAVNKSNMTAIIFWLKTRHPDEWAETQRHEHTGSIGTYEDKIRKIHDRRMAREAAIATSGSDTA